MNYFFRAGTMSVSLSSCSVPGHQPSFTLSQEDMELGLGKVALSPEYTGSVHSDMGCLRSSSLIVKVPIYSFLYSSL